VENSGKGGLQVKQQGVKSTLDLYDSKEVAQKPTKDLTPFYMLFRPLFTLLILK
jgi:hypothetical protein